MKYLPRKLIVLFCAISGTMLVQVFAHDNITVHPAISDSAAQSSVSMRAFLADYFGTSFGSALNQPNLSIHPETFGSSEFPPIRWIKTGSEEEDMPSRRGIEHFYDPTKTPAGGLSDPVALGYDSFTWASDPSKASPFMGGAYTWSDARIHQFNALTNSSYGERQKELALMLLNVGHVLHVNQDLTSPMHVRNDAHPPDVEISLIHVSEPLGPNYTETYGAEHYYADALKAGTLATAFPQRPHGWS
ncbi:MAG: hypothetical protein WCS42_23425, partial [Verrucomicrobiota bacterium]